jgi:hypothetical protein
MFPDAYPNNINVSIYALSFYHKAQYPVSYNSIAGAPLISLCANDGKEDL